MVIATIFSPQNLAVNPNGGTLTLGGCEYITLGFNGINYYSDTTDPKCITTNSAGQSLPAYVSCQQLLQNLSQSSSTNTLVKILLTPSPFPAFNNFVFSIPFIGSALNAIGGAIASIPAPANTTGNITTVNPPSSQQTYVAQECQKQAGNIITIKYDGSDILLLFIELLAISAGLATFASFFNAGGTYVIFIVAALLSVWIVLTTFAAPTFGIIPNPWGVTLYTFLTLGYAIGAIDIVGGGKVL